MGRGKSGFKCLGVYDPPLVLFLCYVNVSEMRPLSLLSSQPLTLPAPRVLLRVKWSLTLFK